MAHTTKYGNTYSDQEWAEMQEAFAEEARQTARFFELKDELITKAAGILNSEFSDVPLNKWKLILENEWEMDKREVRFTSQKKSDRFAAASEWVASEMKKEGLL